MKQTTLISLSLILFFSFAFWSFAQQNDKSGNDHQRHERFAQKLNLTEQQQTTIELLRMKKQKEMSYLKADLQLKKLELKELKTKGNYSRDEFLNMVREINKSKMDISVSKANNRMDIYELLTDEQKQSFDKMGRDFGEHNKKRKHKDKKGN